MALKERWTLRDLIDFESLLGKEDRSTSFPAGVLRKKLRGLEGAKVRRVGMRLWLEEQRAGKQSTGLPGEIWRGARTTLGLAGLVFMFLAGCGVMTGLLDREKMAFHVPLLLAIAVGLPILAVLVAGFTWALKGQVSRSLGFLGSIFGWLIQRLGRGRNSTVSWWGILRKEGGQGWQALVWNLVRLTQVSMICFSLGTIAGLLGCIWFLEVDFYWESTAPEWMAQKILNVTAILSAPFAWAYPDWRPDIDMVERARWGIEAQIGDAREVVSVPFRCNFSVGGLTTDTAMVDLSTEREDSDGEAGLSSKTAPRAVAGNDGHPPC